VLHTAHPIARDLRPNPELEIPFDWQRLLHLYEHKRCSAKDDVELLLAVEELSTAGVTSAASEKADPERRAEYTQWAESWIEASKCSPCSTVDDIEHLLAILETNSHSRDENDQMDLSDPRFDLPQSSRTGAYHKDDGKPISDEDEDQKDEACGLWLVASMANHSCIPNCAVHIPTTSNFASGVLPTLHFRCIRPILAGDELTICYHDEEFTLNSDRQAQLASRGFTCTCPLCVGKIREYMRGAICPSPSCSDGVCAPQRNNDATEWCCDRCCTVLTQAQISAFKTQEEHWMSLWPIFIQSLEQGQKPPLGPLSDLLDTVTTTATHLRDPNLVINAARLTGASSVHLTHAHIFGFLKFVLFEQSVWLRQNYGDDGVSGVLLAMAAIVKRAIGEENASEERRVLGYWLVREARTRGCGPRSRERKAYWTEVEKVGWSCWLGGMKVLYGWDDGDSDM
jgi:hypothetical protein